MINIKVARVPGTVKEVALNDGATVNDALSNAGIRLESGEALKVNGVNAEAGQILRDGDRVVLVKGAKGN